MATLTYSDSDPQQFALYDAEHALAEHRDIVHYRDRHATRAFIDRVLASPEWRALGGPSDVQVVWTKHDSGVATCMPLHRQINLPGWAFNQRTVLHEMAHLLARDAHGPSFAGMALLLYRKFITARFADAMEDSYRKHSVAFKRRRFKYTKKSVA